MRTKNLEQHRLSNGPETFSSRTRLGIARGIDRYSTLPRARGEQLIVSAPLRHMLKRNRSGRGNISIMNHIWD